MEVILIEDVPNLGKIGDLVKVAGGYGRNYLLPRKFAIAASVKNRRRLEHEKRIASFRLAKVQADAESMRRRLAEVSVTIGRKVGDQDKLFGSVTASDIYKAMEAEGLQVDRKKIVLDEPIKTLGVYEVPIRLTGDMKAHVKVWVVAE